MSAARFLNLLASIFGAMGSIYVLKGLAALSPDLIARLSGTYFDFNSAQIESFATQKADSIVGIGLVLIAFAFAAVNIAFVPEDLEFVERRGVALALVAVLAGGAYICLSLAGNAIAKRERVAVGTVLTARALNELFELKRLSRSDVPSLRVYARTLLMMDVPESETPRATLGRLAARVGVMVPEDFDYSDVESP